MIMNIDDSKLQFNKLSLHLLNEEFSADLIKIAGDPRIWKYHPESLHEPHQFKTKWIDKAFKQIDANNRICFAIYVENHIVGSSSYYDIDLENKKLKIGYTWFQPSLWGTSANPLTKIIMIEYAITQLQMQRIEFCVDQLNIPSCQSLTNFGFKFEGVLRNHMVLNNGRVRNSAIFSVIPQEWPEIKNKILNEETSSVNKFMPESRQDIVSPDNIIDVFKYDYWANQRLISNLNKLNDEEYIKSLSVPFGNIQGLLQHIYYYQEKYFQKIVTKSAEFNIDKKLARERLAKQLLLRSQDWLSWAMSSTADVINQKTFAEIMNLFTHNNYHRGQIQIVLSFLGHQPESLDIFLYRDLVS